MKYQQQKNTSPTESAPATGVLLVEDDGKIWLVPFDPANSDLQTFKREVSEGVELQDPDGNVMTQEEVDAFLKTIP